MVFFQRLSDLSMSKSGRNMHKVSRGTKSKETSKTQFFLQTKVEFYLFATCATCFFTYNVALCYCNQICANYKWTISRLFRFWDALFCRKSWWRFEQFVKTSNTFIRMRTLLVCVKTQKVNPQKPNALRATFENTLRFNVVFHLVFARKLNRHQET